MRHVMHGLLAAVCVTVATVTSAQCPITVAWGDVTADGSVNIIDAQQIARSAVGLGVLNVAAVASSGDVTADGVINIVDAQQIARHAVVLSAVPRLGGTHTFPADGAQCAIAAWPGGAAVQTVDATSVFGGNLSGLAYEESGTGTPGVLWAVRNGPGTMYRLTWNGSAWVRDGSNGWSAGKTLRYGTGTGNPDAEGVTLTSTPAAGMYVATERNNDASTTSRNAILRFDVSGSATTLSATHEWNLTADLPAVGANVGIEALTWISDAALVNGGFFDEAQNRTYAPADYADHGIGIFFAGLEANGTIYAYALNHANAAFTRIATISTGLAGVMGLEYDRDEGILWAVCDDGCSGRTVLLAIGATGRFNIVRQLNRPSGMANLNNEGFAIAPQLECASAMRPVFWSDDGETSGHALRAGTIQCAGPAARAAAKQRARPIRPLLPSARRRN